ncbi:MAG: hypothetical protein EPN56_11750 [Rhodanobacter sp.]|nr:MAG: hypothetical protein EPN66_02520 [Rhodanobacter sp.]TAM34955.1 MAG: hypothetical protein EPN56_11750 [Rhodanobacter sp.]
MSGAKSFGQFEAEWRTFLNCLEKAWVKTERACQPFAATFQPWQGQFHHMRKKDMLLRYLKQARDADNHSVQDITKIAPGSVGYHFVNPAGGYIKEMRVVNGLVEHYEGDPMVAEVRPPHPVAVRVKNNGEWYDPPTSHLGQPVNTSHPADLARLGLTYYQSFVAQAERKFFGSAP